jgi:transposase-like protein
MEKSKRRIENEEFWRLALQEQKSSGLSIRAFCRRESLSEPSFYAWRRRIAKRDGGATAIGRQPAQDNNRSTKLLPVALIDEQRSQAEPVGSQRLEITTPAGLTIRFGDSLSAERLLDLLASVLQVERQLGC